MKLFTATHMFRSISFISFFPRVINKKMQSNCHDPCTPYATISRKLSNHKIKIIKNAEASSQHISTFYTIYINYSYQSSSSCSLSLLTLSSCSFISYATHHPIFGINSNVF
eukprot:55543_1